MKFTLLFVALMTLASCASGPVVHLRANCKPADTKGLFYCEDLPEHQIERR